MSDLDLFNLRYQEKCCFECRYYREHKTGAWVSECLLMGRTLSISPDHGDLLDWGRSKVCDGFKKRPKTWRVWSEGVENNPHWKDPYIPRDQIERIRVRFLRGRK